MVGLLGFATKKQLIRASRKVFAEFAFWEQMDPKPNSDLKDTPKFAELNARARSFV